MKLFKDVTIPIIIMLASIISLINFSGTVTADECSQLCGYIAPTTFEMIERKCQQTGDVSNPTFQINWSDGSYSVYNTTFVTLLAVGSCCSDSFTTYQYGSGIVTDGKYSGQPIIESRLFQIDNSQQCNECQTNSGLSRATATRLMTIGTKGVGQWIECTGNDTELLSPALTSTPQMNYVTIMSDFTDCSNCIELC